MNDLNALAGIVQGGQALAYSLGNLDQLFRQTYPGYGYNSGAYYTQYRNWSQTSLDTTLGTLRAAGMQGQQLQNEQSVLTALKASLQSTTGQQQALQALGDVSEQQVEQLMKLRQLMMADMSSKQAYQAAMIQQHAVSEGAAQRFFTYSPATSDGQKFGPGGISDEVFHCNRNHISIDAGLDAERLYEARAFGTSQRDRRCCGERGLRRPVLIASASDRGLVTKTSRLGCPG